MWSTGRPMSIRLFGSALVEGVHPHAAVEHVDRVLVEEHRRRVPRPLELGVEGPDPGARELHRHEPEVREPAGESVADDRCHGVDQVVLRRRQRGERRVGATALPAAMLISWSPRPSHSLSVPLVAGITGVHADDEVELLHPRPERIELGEGERLPSLPGGYRRHADEEDLGAPLVHELELRQRGVVARREADDGRGVQRVRVDVRPVLVHPGVERVDDRDAHVGVVGHAFLDRAGQGRPQQRAVDAHLLHELEAWLRIEERVDAGHHHHLLADRPGRGRRRRTPCPPWSRRSRHHRAPRPSRTSGSGCSCRSGRGSRASCGRPPRRT